MIRRNLVTERIAKPWHRLCKALVESPPLEGFKRPVNRSSGGLGSVRLTVGSVNLKGLPSKMIVPFCEGIHVQNMPPGPASYISVEERPLKALLMKMLMKYSKHRQE